MAKNREARKPKKVVAKGQNTQTTNSTENASK